MSDPCPVCGEPYLKALELEGAPAHIVGGVCYVHSYPTPTARGHACSTAVVNGERQNNSTTLGFQRSP